MLFATRPAGLPRIPSLVFDTEEDTQKLEEVVAKTFMDSGAEQVLELQRFLLPTGTGRKVVLDVQEAMHEQQPQDPQLATEVLALALSRRGYAVRLRRAMGGGPGTACLRQLRHVFLTVVHPGPDRQSFIVDPAFSDCFQIAKPTPRYLAVLASLDGVLVIPEDRITGLVMFLCGEMQQAFQETDAVLPPWRAATSMLSRWQPRRSMDETITMPRQSTCGMSNGHADIARTVSSRHVAAEPLRIYGFSGCKHIIG